MQVLIWLVALSLLSAAAALGAATWRTIRGARERESARIELLRALAFPDAAVPASGPSILGGLAEFQPEDEAAPALQAHDAAPIFADGAANSMQAFPRRLALAGVAAAMLLGVAIYAVIARGPQAADTPTTAAAAKPIERTTTADVRPIELIALQHSFGPAMAFAVSGLVRNPADGVALPEVEAVIHLVGSDGRILTSQTTMLERPVLEAGQTSGFSLVFPPVSGPVARFQVEFRGHGRDRILHVDRRAAQSAANAARN